MLLDLTRDERFATGRALVLRRVPFRWVGPNYVLSLVESDMAIIHKSKFLEGLVDARTAIQSYASSPTKRTPAQIRLTEWLGAEWRFFLDQLVTEGSVERRVTRVRAEKPKIWKRAGLTADQWTALYQAPRKDVLEIRASELSSLHDEYMPERSRVALAALPMSSLTLLQILAQAADDPELD
jgi:hypothetical protein